MQGLLGPDAGVVDHQLQHPGRGQQDAPAAQFPDQQTGELTRLAVGLRHRREPGDEVAGLSTAEALEAAVTHQLGQLLAPGLGTVGAGAENGRIDAELARDEGDHGGGRPLAGFQGAARMAQGAKEQGIAEPVGRAALGRD